MGVLVDLALGKITKEEARERRTAELAEPLEVRIRRMAAWWSYSEAELQVALRAALRDPAEWQILVEADETWRRAHPDRRPTASEAGHA